MNFSALFIRRPVATILLMVGVIMAGILGYRQLPVAALPNASLPTINVSANLAGASPETMASSVATPLIKQFETIAGINNISASSTLGNSSITIQFDLSRNIDAAAADVQAAISRAMRQLPSDMTEVPSFRKLNPADAPVLFMVLTSTGPSLTKVDDIAENVVAPSLSTLPGVAQAIIFGAHSYAVRVDVHPRRLDALGLNMPMVASALAAANDRTPVGTMQNGPQALSIAANTQLTDAAAFRQLVIAAPGGNLVRLGDVAHVYDGVLNPRQGSWFDGHPAIAVAVQRQPEANTVAVVDAIRRLVPKLNADLPAGVQLQIVNNAAAPIKAAVADVQGTLAITVGLVMLVIFLFLRRLPATLIPGVAVPLSLVSTVGLMYFLGYSIDNISLLGLTLSVGLVVDDAIVMLENIVRRMELGEAPMAAALTGSREVTGTIISMSLSLVAVFLPVLLMGGVVGRILNEFGVVVTLAILSSAVVSLTATPMLTARLPVPSHSKARHDAGAARWTRRYGEWVDWCLRHQRLVLAVFVATALGSYAMFMSMPRGFLPTESLGTAIITSQARPDISFDALKALELKAQEIVRANPGVAHATAIIGNGDNSARMFVQLKDPQGNPPQPVVLAQLRRALDGLPGLRSFITPIQSIRFGGRPTQSQYQLVLQSVDGNLSRLWAAKLETAMRADSAHFIDVASDAQNSAQQAQIVVDHTAASRLGVSAKALRSTLQMGFGNFVATQIQTTGSSYDVVLQFDPRARWDEAALAAIRVPSSNGMLVPLSAFARVERGSGPVAVNQSGQLTSVTLSFNLPSGVSLSAAEQQISLLKRQIGLPSTVLTSYAGSAALFQSASGNMGVLILAAVLTIYVVLGILYESFIHPLTILSGLPSAALGALITLRLGGFDLSLIALIGILMLIGIVKKNAIMMVDVALVLMRDEGASAAAAIREAAVRRFRPIMMTTFCAFLGVLPIALGTGASSELRQPLGVAVAGGLVVSQALTLFITPVIFLYMERIASWGRRYLARWLPVATA